MIMLMYIRQCFDRRSSLLYIKSYTIIIPRQEITKSCLDLAINGSLNPYIFDSIVVEYKILESDEFREMVRKMVGFQGGL